MQDLLTGMRFFERPAAMIDAGRTESVARLMLRCVAALAILDADLLQCAAPLVVQVGPFFVAF